MTTSTSAFEGLLARRQRVLAPTYRLFYEQPLHIVRAEGVWLYDADGRRYLDAYNNVPVVGHSHPEVAARIAQQATTLNTHTRYLTDRPVELAERLLATMPRELSCTTFTCTGSESNDLAVRVAKAATGGTGLLVTDGAYHGTTETLTGMSPVTGAPLGRDVFTLEAPVNSTSPTEFGDRVATAIERMQSAGVKPAALIVDTILGSDGVMADPAGFLSPAVEHIHGAGGLFIADEVQPGFGRTGTAMWGFQRHRITPDLVSMGKPMGNGIPVAALVARPEVMAEFARGFRYFNTFGGNSVSCAAALAVLDIIERDRLIEHARDMGEYLLQGLRNVAGHRSAVQAIRGAGLFAGVQLPSPEIATRVVNAMRQAGVLIGAAGRRADSLKIRPPLPIGRREIDTLLGCLNTALRDVA